MTAIRVALIGLSSVAKTSWAAQGHLPYLSSAKGRRHYEIVALLNSTKSAAEAARQHFGLPSNVRTYGDPTLLAQDPEVDLVVCNTRVDVHFSSIEPSIAAGKAVYVEWPLTENLQRAYQLTRGQPLPNSIMGLQGRVAPVITTLKDLLDSGRIGPVLSSDIKAFGKLLANDALPTGLSYFAERAVGGNPITIAYAHMIDFVHEVLGNFESFQSRMTIQQPTIKLLGSGGEDLGTVTSDVPDFLAVHGIVKGRRTASDGAVLAVTFRNGKPFKDTPAFTWTINGQKGEILVVSPSGPYIHSDSYHAPITIQVHDHATNQVETVEWDWEDWQKELPIRARIVAELYERFAWWWENGRPTGQLPDNREWPRLHDGLGRLQELEELFAQYDKQQ
ncbi:hypothetical protein PFICI_04178 [Pestalotiopsis fici W106-1]|uniref:Uncharacterized protein n=1 Tax=Pestalotiopsis fici (strain W106-1 / CGMCC3.15140) TaxID=1229662 RepID=W3XJB8_PESFW|nr:uncharacterized protein PFICI_04178 [Pestalotiopsis fici W106-1]ETS86153.1 hypothetical protein PFICI_04178 [Pestalotiopsis fici W106-1]